MPSTDAVAREAAWLAASGDGLPALTKDAGGPWDIVQGYVTRTPAQRKSAIYVLRPTVTERRESNQRKLQTFSYLLKLFWPIGSTTITENLWETEQAAFDDAVELLLTRIRGTVFDHTHGGRFMSVAEAPEPARITVHMVDPETTLSSSPACLRATVNYDADDRDFVA